MEESDAARLIAVVVLPSDGEEPVTRSTWAPSARVLAVTVPRRVRYASATAGEMRRGPSGASPDSFGSRGVPDHRQAVEGPEFAAELRIEDLGGEGGGDTQHEPGEEAA